VKLGEVAARLGLELEGDPTLELRGLAGLADARPDELSFVNGARYRDAFERSRAGAVVVPYGFDTAQRPCLRSHEPYYDFTRVFPLFYAVAVPEPGVHATALVGADCALGEGVAVGAYAVVGAGCRIGARTRIHPRAVLYPGVVLGADCEVHAGAVLHSGVSAGDRVLIHSNAVIGSTGFGFAIRSDGSRARVPHPCGVQIEDDVEIGANTTIDASHPGHPRHGRERTSTWIGRGVKIDDQVHVAHGCHIEAGATLCAHVGLAGNTHVGRNVLFLGKSSSGGHLHVGDGAVIGGDTPVVKDLEPGVQILSALPGVERRQWGRIYAWIKRIPELAQRVRALEQSRRDP
jgi:UDP-3-O-[3-hydroxymyristoyl] glucosamine N-acyltransferase